MYVLVLFYSRHGNVAALADEVAQGIEATGLAEARLRTVPPVAPQTETALPPVPGEGAPYVTKADLEHAAALALGSPTRFGNMAAPMKHFLDSTSDLWVSGALIGKPAGVFTSTSSMHGGQETTLVSMMLPLLHHGMVIAGVPYSEGALTATTTGGTPYGPSHVAGPDNDQPVSADERAIARALGRRLAELASRLA